MMKSTVSTIMSGKPPKGINKYMLEEVFFSESCKVGDEYSTDGGNNPQNARFVDGRYYFNLPDLWYNHMSNNKAIALRKIDLTPGSLNLNFKAVVRRQTANAGNYGDREFTVELVVKPFDSTNTILENLCREMSKLFNPRTTARPFGTSPEKTVSFEPYYDYNRSIAKIRAKRLYVLNEGDAETHYFSWFIKDLNEDAKYFFNTVQNPINMVDPARDKDGTMEHIFNHIWNRQFLFVHASFVNGTSFNYLGRSGEFYPKPSKMYRYGGSSQQFYFELSFDGRNPIRGDRRFGQFCIDLAFIYHDRDYQAE